MPDHPAGGQSNAPDAAVPSRRAGALRVVLQCKALRDRFDEVGLDAARDRWVPGLRHLARQFRDALNGLHRLCLRYDPFLHEQMEEALAQHQGDTALRIGHWGHHFKQTFHTPAIFLLEGLLSRPNRHYSSIARHGSGGCCAEAVFYEQCSPARSLRLLAQHCLQDCRQPRFQT